MIRLLSILLLVFAFVSFTGLDSQAAPKGIKGVTVGKKLFSFNVIVHPNDWTPGGNACNGARIFFNEDNGVLGTIEWKLYPSASNWSITDCDGTGAGDGYALVEVPESVHFLVFVRLVGPKNSSLDLTCTELVDAPPNDDLCLIDEADVIITQNPDSFKYNLSKSSAFTKIMENLVDGAFEDVLWYFDNSVNAKILQVWVYEVPAA